MLAGLKGPMIHYYETIDSTNLRAKQLAESGAPDGTVVIAEAQTGGRGRMGRSFHSPAGSGIYLSMVLRPQFPAIQLMHLTCSVAVAMCDAVHSATGLRPGIKWTNDLVYGEKKLGGILTELSLDARGNVAYAIVGIGINCCQKESDFPEDIRSIATSLSAVTGSAVDRSRIAGAMIEALSTMTNDLLSKKVSIMDRYRKGCITTGKDVCLVNGEQVRHGFAESVDDDGRLIVIFPDGHRETVNAGEVSVRGMYGYLN